MAGRDDRYTRHCIYDDPNGRFSILALVWKAGQFSPVHGHRTWCGYGVYRGTLRETDYAYDPATGTAGPNGDVDRIQGDAVFSEAGLDGIHRLGNPGGGLGISIHVYGVDASRIATDVNWVVRS
jgi:predicted metal-dependent enzyme (double-stranded beta helix superfamily)